MKYDIICADLPLHYNQRSAHFNDGTQHKKTKFGGGADGNYDLMDDAKLLTLAPLINKIAADDAILYLWMTWPKLPYCLEFMKAAGFEYKTCAYLWEKISKSGDPAYGPGAWTSSNTEAVLLGTKRKKKAGRFSLAPAKRMINQIVRAEELFGDDNLSEDFDTIVDSMNGQIILAPRSRHSEKPEEVQDRIELMHPGKKKLELFARRTRPGWTATGNQNDTNCMDIFEFLHKEIAENEGNG